MFRSAVFAVLAVALSSSSVFAQGAVLENASASGLEPIKYVVVVRPDAPLRPKALVPLYLSMGALQGLDLFTTFRALDQGSREANPILRSQNRAGMIVVKAAASCLNVYLAEKLWKKNRGAAIAAMIIGNGLTAVVVANNTRMIARR